MTDLGFSRVGSKGTGKETGMLRAKVGEECVFLEVHFLETILKGLLVIVGLGNELNCVDLERGEGKLGRHYFSCHMQEDKKEEDEIAKAAGVDKDLEALLEKYSKLFSGDEKYFPVSKLPPVKIELLSDARQTSTSYVSRKRANDRRRDRRDGCKGTVGKDSRPSVGLPVFRGKS